MNKKVREFEEEMATFVGFKYAIFCSSGSTANTILAMYLRDKLKNEKSTRNIVVLPSTTWTTSCSPWIREGFEPHFIDISLDNFGMDRGKLLEYLKNNHEKIAAVFPTSLLGFNIDACWLKYRKKEYPEIEFFIDQCENTFGGFANYHSANYNLFTCTTSTYMGHELQSVEGGFIFTNNELEYAQFLMYRNHGMTRSLDGAVSKTWADGYKSSKVDSRFDFYSLGNNFRNSDIHAMIGLLDLKRKYKYIKQRRKLYGLFQFNLNRHRYILPEDSFYLGTSWHVPFCVPIICKDCDAMGRLQKIKSYCHENRIETRPIISGFLGYQTAYKEYFSDYDREHPKEKYPNSTYLHDFGIYVGLNTKIKKNQILKLVDFLNKI
jgi:CDP-6-deoxy-D-xylo-4-hexulose-3-dehydrase